MKQKIIELIRYFADLLEEPAEYNAHYADLIVEVNKIQEAKDLLAELENE